MPESIEELTKKDAFIDAPKSVQFSILQDEFPPFAGATPDQQESILNDLLPKQPILNRLSETVDAAFEFISEIPDTVSAIGREIMRDQMTKMGLDEEDLPRPGTGQAGKGALGALRTAGMPFEAIGDVAGGTVETALVESRPLQEMAFGDSISHETAETVGDVTAFAAEVAIPVAGAKKIAEGNRIFRRFMKMDPEAFAKSHVKGEVDVLPLPDGAGKAVDDAFPQQAQFDFDALPGAKPTFARAIPEDLVEPQFRLDSHKKVTKVATELFEAGGVKRDPEKFPLISDQIMEMLKEGKVSDKALNNALERNHISFVEMAEPLFRTTVADGARMMQALSVVQRRLNTLSKRSGPKTEQEIADLIALQPGMLLEPTHIVGAMFRRMNNIGRGIMVTQLATAVRNALSQVARVGMDVLDSVIDASFAKLAGKTAARHPLDGFENLVTILRKGNKAELKEMFDLFPQLENKAFNQYVSDVSRRVEGGGVGIKAIDKAFDVGDSTVAVLNTVNRFQEYVIRRGVIRAGIVQKLRARGTTLAEEVAKIKAATSRQQAALQEFGEGSTQFVKASADLKRVAAPLDDDLVPVIDRALEMTFASAPKSKTVRSIVNFINSSPVSLIVPFPRFMANSTRFLFEFSPLGFTKLLSGKQLAAIAAGDMSVLSRAAIGSIMLGAAIQARRSDLAGPKWYQFKKGEGEEENRTLRQHFVNQGLSTEAVDKRMALAKRSQYIDIRPFNPYAAHFFVADMFVRAERGTLILGPGLYKDLVTGLFSVNVRAGTGLFAVDSFTRAFLGEEQVSTEPMSNFAGEIMARIFTPLQTISDVFGEFNPDDAEVRDKRSNLSSSDLETKRNPLLTPSQARIPASLASMFPVLTELTAAGLDPYYIPTRSTPLTRLNPAERQGTGLSTQSMNALEKENARLDIRPYQIQKKTGVAVFDQLVAKNMGKILEIAGNRLVKLSAFRRLTTIKKRFALMSGPNGFFPGTKIPVPLFRHAQTAAKNKAMETVEKFAVLQVKAIKGTGKDLSKAEILQVPAVNVLWELEKKQKLNRDQEVFLEELLGIR